METLTFRHPRLVALIILVLVSAGLSSFLSLGRQEDPTITNLFATVTTQFPGGRSGTGRSAGYGRDRGRTAKNRRGG